MTNLIKIEEYKEIEDKLAEVRDAANFLPDVTTDEGYEKSKRVSLDVGKLLTALEKKRKDKKKYFLDGGKAVDSQAKAIAAELEEMQLPHKQAYKELDNLKKQREADRKQALEDRVAYIRNLPEEMKDSHSSEIKAAYESIQADECLDYYEFTEQALKARNSSVGALSKLFTATLKAEEDAIELDKLRKQAAEREQKEREDKIARDAAKKAEREKAEAIAQAEKEKTASAEREEKAKRDAEQAKRLQAEAEANAKIQAEKAAEDAKNAEIERQRLQAEAEAEEVRKREANRKHVGAVRKEAKESLMLLGVDEDTAKKIVLAINSGAVSHVSISY
jgi:peptidoglycan DL-endopeptidase RipA